MELPRGIDENTNQNVEPSPSHEASAVHRQSSGISSRPSGIDRECDGHTIVGSSGIAAQSIRTELAVGAVDRTGCRCHCLFIILLLLLCIVICSRIASSTCRC